MKRIVLLSVFLFATAFGQAQMVPMESWNSAKIKHELQKLQTLGSVLYMAAHPDDENTRLITYFANGKGYHTTYLSLTRGDGGQNLIGKEVREELGVIRTQELLAARRTDGGHQRFSRANDFGYSKTPEETFNIWDKEDVLADAVWTIRLLQPDVIVTRFSPTRGGTHGHHTGSAIIAMEAFEKAADKNAFPEQLKHVDTWQVKRVLWNTHPWFYGGEDKFDPTGKLKIDAGGYDPLLGKSYGEIAALSRSQHKCQGFGASLQRGEIDEWLVHLKGDSTAVDLFDGIDPTWKRVPGGKNVEKLLAKAIESYDMNKPSASIPQLVKVLTELKKLDQKNVWVKRKSNDLENLILQCAGVYSEAASTDYSAVPGSKIKLQSRVINRSSEKITLEKIDFGIHSFSLDSTLNSNHLYESDLEITLPKDFNYSSPYWLNEKASLGMYWVEDQQLRGTPQNQAALSANFTYHFPDYGMKISRQVPVMYRWVDPSVGELYRPLEILPPATVGFDGPVYLLSGAEDKKSISVRVQSQQETASGKVRIKAPKEWKISPAEFDFSIDRKGGEQVFTFELSTMATSSDVVISAEVETEGKVYNQNLVRIDYDHIPMQALLPKATARLVKLNLQKKGQLIGYIMGAGDAVPEALQSIGYEVKVLSDEEITSENLPQFDAVLVGIRAYNTNENMQFHQQKLLEYVKNGGNLIIQYNTNRGLKVDEAELGPYPLKLSRDRVTEEDAEMVFLDPKHEILNSPNKLTKADFDGWVQERGLYFPNEWDEKYTPIFGSHDQGEEETKGALLVADYGSGKYIYTGISFFRELPAGVPGAYRLLANLISYGKSENP